MTRQERWDAVRERYIGSAIDFDPTPERYATVVEDESGLRAAETFDSRREALDYAGVGVLDGWTPVAVFDLDTGESFGLHVSVKVTISKDASAPESPWAS